MPLISALLPATWLLGSLAPRSPLTCTLPRRRTLRAGSYGTRTRGCLPCAPAPGAEGERRRMLRRGVPENGARCQLDTATPLIGATTGT